ncbi:hypothetical protein EAF04_005600 [Stromatinia cepivora]|nr:hypothetical protein EAF04_005600 [Stromatinia cepivora]
MYLLVLGAQDVGKTLMVSRMIGDLPILHLSENNHSNPMKYLVMPEMGSPLKLELILQECSTSEELSKIIAENNHFPSNVVLMFHCGSDTSFETCEVFYRMIQEHRIQCEFLWIANTDYSFGGTSGWKERIARLVDESEPRFLLTSLVNPDLDLRNIISSFFSDISKNNQFTINQPFLDNQSSSRSSITTFEVSRERFESPRINGSLINEKHTDWQTRRDGFVMEPQVRFWIGGRDDVEEKSQELAAAQSDCIPSTTLGKGYGADISNETSGWYPDDEKEAWVEWRAYWSTSIQWLRCLYFSCISRR